MSNLTLLISADLYKARFITTWKGKILSMNFLSCVFTSACILIFAPLVVIFNPCKKLIFPGFKAMIHLTTMF